MKEWLRGQRGGLLGFAVILTLVAGGLGWVTAAALRLEREQRAARAEAEQINQLRLALWRLDSLVAPVLAKEESRPYNHYSTIFAPANALQSDGQAWQPGTVLEPSPLLNAELPDWVLLHFQVDQSGWRSPQVLSQPLAARLKAAALKISLSNVTLERAQLLNQLRGHVQAISLVALIREQNTRPPLSDTALVPGANTANSLSQFAQGIAQTNSAQQGQAQKIDPEFLSRYNRQMENQTRNEARQPKDDSRVALENLNRNGENWFASKRAIRKPSEQVQVTLGSMTPLWLNLEGQPDQLFYARLVKIGSQELCQGTLLDWPRLQQLLLDEVRRDLLPEASLIPMHEARTEHSERTMAVLPVQLDPGPLSGAQEASGWTPLRFGLVMAWAAALVALTAVALGGWTLIDLSERRIRFVSAVTHELRTPLTTLRLYLDMLTGGLVTDAKKKEEYLHTLNAEADRLNRLLGNVLDFSRLENQRPRLVKDWVRLDDLLNQVAAAWQSRCLGAGKELVVDIRASGNHALFTDVQLVQQILGNLIDNSCKYSRGALDRRIWLRAKEAMHVLVLEVEDCGPGVPARERRSIFRAFRRGRDAGVTGGVGLGLALARRWANLLGGTLRICNEAGRRGACFQLVLPSAPATSQLPPIAHR